MRPIRLEMEAFGPYVTRQVVDFEKLARAGMFLIKGPTGSGKTTIFDAMTFALFGGASGTKDGRNVRNDMEEWRCNQAPADAPTVVSFTFSADGRTYRFTRGLVPKRKNLSALLEGGEILKDGTYVPFFENAKKDELTARAEALTGLTKEQFRQVVVLPQGQFENFLTASSKEKEDILRKIFGAGRWEAYAERMVLSATDRVKALEDDKRMVENSLAEEGLEELSALAARIEEKKAALTEKTKEHIAFDGRKKAQALAADRTLAGLFRPLFSAEKNLAALEARAPAIEEDRRRFAAAEKAEALRRPAEEAKGASAALLTRKEGLGLAARRLDEKTRALEDAKTKKEAHEKNSPVEKLQAEIAKTDAARPAYRLLGECEKALAAALAGGNAARTRADAAEAEAVRARDAAAKAKKDHDEAEDRLRDRRDRYYAGIYGEIARELADGRPCPVCGAVRHPAPAAPRPDAVTKKDVEDCEKERARLKKLWDAAEKTREAAQEKQKAAVAALAEARETFAKAKAARDAAHGRLLEGIPDEAALEKTVASLQRQIAVFTEASHSLSDALAAADRAHAHAAAEAANAEKEVAAAEEKNRAAREKLVSLLSAAGYENEEALFADLLPAEERKALGEGIVSWETSVADLRRDVALKREELRDRTPPDEAAFAARQKAIDDEAEAFAGFEASVTREIARLTEKLALLSPKAKRVADEKDAAQAELKFAKAVRGDTGVGLQRYVLAVMFNRVIAEANRMLEGVHGGRYRLFRSDEKGSSTQRGLELRVTDSRSSDPRGRSVALLSGGEKFLVSLALSIGMSTAAANAGVRLDALFIDEGFGTLGPESIGDAMTILKNVRGGNAMIGIISHVQLIEETVTEGLEIVKTNAGSYIKER